MIPSNSKHAFLLGVVVGVIVVPPVLRTVMRRKTAANPATR